MIIAVKISTQNPLKRLMLIFVNTDLIKSHSILQGDTMKNIVFALFLGLFLAACASDGAKSDAADTNATEINASEANATEANATEAAK